MGLGVRERQAWLVIAIANMADAFLSPTI